MAVKDKIAGQWRGVQKMYDKIGSQWRPVLGEWKKVNGQWRKTFDGSFGVYFQEYKQNPERLTGTWKLENQGDALFAQISGWAGGESNVMAIGWMIKNIPLDAQVAVTWELWKGQFPQNDGVVSTGGGQLNNYSYSTGLITTTYTNHKGWINFVLNFFCEQQNATTSYIKITKVMFGSRQVFLRQREGVNDHGRIGDGAPRD